MSRQAKARGLTDLLAYVFFHQVVGDADSAEYEEGLRRFHAALAEAGVPGFVGSRTFRVDGRYCDWYVVQTSAALDPLNKAAVSGPRSRPHAAVASHATDFAGKLLKLVTGAYDPEARCEVRFAKPAGMSYEDLYTRLEPWTNRGDVSLWRRMMVLGPPPEFCVLMPQVEKLPEELDPVAFRREPV